MRAQRPIGGASRGARPRCGRECFCGSPGLLPCLQRWGAFDVERLFADWGAPLEIEAATTRRSEQWDKFEDRAARALPRERIASLVERLETLDKVVDISQATRLLQTSALHRPQAKKVVFAARGQHEPEETSWVP